MAAEKTIRRIAILGIGHELRGDDAAGLEVARRLQPLAVENPDLLVLETGPVPESFTGPLRRFAPELIVLVDAAQMDEPPGTLRFLDWREAAGLASSTHSFPLDIFAAYLVQELGCRIDLLGIQPADNRLDSPLTMEVESAVQEAVIRLVRMVESSNPDLFSKAYAGNGKSRG